MINEIRINNKLLTVLTILAFVISMFGLVTPLTNDPVTFSDDIQPIIGDPVSEIRKSVNALTFPISILSDSDWGNYPEITGTGTPLDPYVISGVTNPLGTGNLIHIANTGKHFLIEGNTFDGVSPGSGSNGISLSNAANGNIRNNDFLNIGMGIFLGSSSNIVIEGNTITNVNDGIAVHHGSVGNTVKNNFISDVSSIGIWVSRSEGSPPPSGNLFDGNTVVNGGTYGIGQWVSDDNIYTNNYVSGFFKGFTLSSASFAQLSNNKFENNVYGLFIEEWTDYTEPSGLPNENFVSFNEFSGNNFGIYIEEGTQNHFHDNIILQSGSYGYWANDLTTYENEIIFNDFILNNEGGDGQAYDGSDWFDHNFWSDHDNTDSDGDGIADTPYPISGPGGNVDLNPVTSPHRLSRSFSGGSLSFPTGGEVLNDVEDVTWNPGFDSWSYQLFYVLSYTTSGGDEWINLTATTATGYLWDTTVHPDGDNYQLRLITMNLHGDVAYDYTNNFEVLNIVFYGGDILYPNGGETLGGIVDVSWSPGFDAFGNPLTYTLYHSSDGRKWTLITTTSATTYSWDTRTMVDGTYWLRLVTDNGDAGSWAEDITDGSFNILNIILTGGQLIHPTGGETLFGTVLVEWTAGSDAHGNLVNYALFYYDGEEWNFLTNVTTISYSWDTTTVWDGDYMLKLVTGNGHGLTEEDQSGFFSIQQPHVFTGGQITSPSDQDTVFGVIDVTWSPGFDSWDNTLYYNLSHSDDGGESWTFIGTTISGSIPWDTTNTPDNDNNRLRLITNNLVGNETTNYSSIFAIEQPHVFSGGEITFPNGGEAVKDTITVTWSAGQDNKYSLFYNLSYSTDGNVWTSVAEELTTTSYSWDTTTVDDGDTYLVNVVTYNKQGDSAFDTSDAVFEIQNVYLDPIYVVGDRAFAALGFPGSGTEEDPYVIEQKIFTSFEAVLFEVHDTTVYFIVRDTLFDGINHSFNAIVLDNVVNAIFERNNVTNAVTGIFVYNSANLVFESNRIYFNFEYGLWAKNSNNLDILTNHIFDNGEDGIFSENTHSSLIQGNQVFNNGFGIVTLNTKFATFKITGMTGFLGSGIFLDPSHHNTVDSNNIYDNSISGLQLLDSNHTIVTSNDINGNGLNGIVVIDSSHGVFDDNDVLGNGFSAGSQDESYATFARLSKASPSGLNGFLGSGIFLDPSSNNTVSNSTIGGNTDNGVFLSVTDDTVISGNTITYNGIGGIWVEDSHDFEITGNTIGGNGNFTTLGTASVSGLSGFLGSGIFLDPSDGGLVSGNTIFDNANNGLHLYLTFNIDIDNNTINGNDLHGVFLEDSSSNTISENTIYQNGLISNSLVSTAGVSSASGLSGFLGSGIFLDPADDNNVTGNTVYENSLHGIHLQETDESTVNGNTVSGNGEHGLFLEDSSHNTVKGNTITDNGHFVGTSSVSGMSGFLGSGIFLDPSTDNVVEGNVVANNAENGIHLQLTDNTQILGNNVSDNGINGIFLEDSKDNVIKQNNVTSNGGSAGTASMSGLQGFLGSGIFLDPGSNNTVDDNYVSDNAFFGVSLLAMDDSEILNNEIVNNGVVGLSIQNSSSNLIQGNDIGNNSQQAGLASANGLSGFLGSGIFLDPSFYNIFRDNNIFNNLFGAQVEGSSGNSFFGNIFKDNFDYGLLFDFFSSGNDASGNDFINNNDGGIQAYDDGGNDFSTNFWSDLEDPTEPYIIDGGAGSTDEDPLPDPLNFEAPFIGIPYVIKPNGKEHLKGTVKVKWTLVDPEPDVVVTYYVFYGELVEVEDPVGHEWYEENTVNEWVLIDSVEDYNRLWWDTTTVDNGKYLIKVIAEADGYERFDSSDRFFHVRNKKNTKPTVPTSPGFELLGILGLVLVGYLYKKKKF
ncbi:MAG: right-handed parallel beta-helix repeat-containing protein [Candidatus Hodarchaeales archaeon]|jgi:parallel beta-helix repeat protein